MRRIGINMINILKRRSIDATKGPILSQFILFALPIAIGGIIQSLFNAADMIVLGNYASSVQVASVGATTVIISLLIQTCIGLSGGAQVVLSQSFGEGEKEKIRKATNTTLWIAIVLGILVTAVAIPASETLLRVTKCPDECFVDAAAYLKIYFAAAPAILIYNYGGAIIRSSGDSQRPLYYLIASGVLNVVLNFILCIVLSQKVLAVAIATLASQVLGAALVIIHLVKTEAPCRLTLKGFLPDGKILSKIMLIGIPSALSSALYPISNMQIQSAINSFGYSATAGNAAATSIEAFVFCFNGAVGTAALTFVGQNYGAKNPERIRETVRKGLLVAVATGFVLGYLCLFLGRFALKAYLPEDVEAISYGMVRFKYLMTVFFITTFGNILSNVLAAFGYSVLGMANSLVSVIGLRMIWMAFIFPRYPTFEVLFQCYTISWSLSSVIFLIMFAIVYPRKLRKIRTDVEKNENEAPKSV